MKRITAKYPVLPILDSVFMDIGRGNLYLTTTDLEKTITATVVVEHRDTGQAVVPIKPLCDFLKYLPEQPITVDIDSFTKIVQITTNDGKYSFQGDNPGDFPKILIVKSEPGNTCHYNANKHKQMTSTYQVFCDVYKTSLKADTHIVKNKATKLHLTIKDGKNTIKLSLWKQDTEVLAKYLKVMAKNLT